MELMTYAHDAFEKNAQLDVFYADIAKAFDRVNPYLLVEKMAKLPVANAFLKWLSSYLSGRFQYVQLHNARSEFFEVFSGVGQGTILGPLLFSTFFNDSDTEIADINCLNFADDKKVSALVRNSDDAEKLQRAIDQFIRWCEKNDLDVNFTKCKIITFTHKRAPIIYKYTVNGQPIDRVFEIRDLGVLLSSKLDFNTHFEYLHKKANGALQFVKRQTYFCDRDVTMILYNALVRSNLEFATSIWSPYHSCHRVTIESTQKQFVIFLNGDNHRPADQYILSPYTERCTNAGLQTLIRRIINAIVLFVHSIISGRFKCPALRAQLDLNTGVRTLRNPEFIRIKAARTEKSLYSPFNSACRMYNFAALYIDPTLSFNDFRCKLMKLQDGQFGPWSKLDHLHNV